MGEITVDSKKYTDMSQSIIITEGFPNSELNAFTTYGFRRHAFGTQDHYHRYELCLVASAINDKTEITQALIGTAVNLLSIDFEVGVGTYIYFTEPVIAHSTCKGFFLAPADADAFPNLSYIPSDVIALNLLPITESEINFIRENGSEKFWDKMVESHVHWFDFYRESFV